MRSISRVFFSPISILHRKLFIILPYILTSLNKKFKKKKERNSNNFRNLTVSERVLYYSTQKASPHVITSPSQATGFKNGCRRVVLKCEYIINQQ